MGTKERDQGDPRQAPAPDGHGEGTFATDRTLQPEAEVSVEDTLPAATMGSSAETLPALTAESGDVAELPTRYPARYKRRKEIARGGMGRIVSVRDRELGREVAIKELLEPSPALEKRFEREVRITARLQHPSIIAVHEAGRWPTGEPFYAMKHVEGRSLDKVIADKQTLEERLGVLSNIIAVADALAYAHGQRVIHRDLKPANILVGDFGETVVIDWGLAKDLREAAVSEAPAPGLDQDSHEALTVFGQAVGTPAYMPPRQAKGEPVDERADVYALGAILYHLLAGEMPYRDANPTSARDLLAKVIQGPPTPLLELQPHAPRELVAITGKALARDRDERYADAGELAEDLKRFQRGQMVSAHQYTLAAMVRRWIAHHRTLSVSAAAVLIVAITAGILAFSREQRLRREAQQARDRAELEQEHAAEQRDRAERQTLALLEQQGRSELEADHPRRAAVLLSAVAVHEPDNQVVRSLLSEAVRHLDTLSAHRVLRGHQGDVLAVAYSPDGSRLATAGRDKSIRIIDAATGDEIVALEGHERDVRDVAFSPDGTLLVSASFDGTARVWKVDSGEATLVFRGHQDRVLAAEFSPNGKQIVTGGRDRTARVWNATTGREQRVLRHHQQLSEVRFSSDDTQLVTASGSVLSIWAASTGKALRSIIVGDQIHAMALTADGRHALTGAGDRTARVWDIASGEAILTLRDHAAAVNAIAVSRSGRLMATGDRDGTIRLWDARTGALLAAAETRLRGFIRGLAFAPDGRYLASVGKDGHAAIWAVDVGESARILETSRYPHAAAYSPDGKRIALGSYMGQLEIWNVATRRAELRVEAHGDVWDLRWSPDSSRIVTTGWVDSAQFSDHDVPRLWDSATCELRAVLRGHTDQVYSVAFGADGNQIATASWDGTVRRWDGITGAPKGVFTSLEGSRYYAAAFSPDGLHLATVAGDGILRVFALASGSQPVGEVRAHTSSIDSVTYSADGRRILTGGRDDYLAKVWDAETLTSLAVLEGHSGRLMSAAFSRDGALVATTSFDETTKLWEADTGNLLRTIDSRWHVAAFSPDGTHLLTSAPRSESVIEWDISLDPRSPQELAAAVDRQSPWQLVEGRLVLKSHQK